MMACNTFRVRSYKIMRVCDMKRMLLASVLVLISVASACTIETETVTIPAENVTITETTIITETTSATVTEIATSVATITITTTMPEVSTTETRPWPPIASVRTRVVPEPASVPWKDVPAYTEETYEINGKVGDEFAIGLFATGDITFFSSIDSDYLTTVDMQSVPYSPQELNKNHTDWYLLKAIKSGTVEIQFHYPLGYFKYYSIIIDK